jgi:CheY-like chemotaxis protein
MSNAIKFTDLGGKINVLIKQISSIDNQTEIAFSIEDNGVGMTKEQQLNVFAAFTQADVSITRKYGGTGLGLTISTKFLELMGSELKLESQKEKGTKFYFSIQFEEVLENTELANVLPFIDHQICKYKYNAPVQQDLYLDRYFEYYDIESKHFTTPSELKKCNDNQTLKSIWIDVDDSDDNLLDSIHRLKSEKVVLLSSFDNRTRLDALNLNVAKILYKPITPSKIVQGLNSSQNPKESPQTVKKTSTSSSPFDNIQFEGTILVAEDNFINQKLIKQVLLKYGVNVELANNGLEAFEKRKSEQYDLIFMDIQMPVMDGVEATHEIINYEIEEELTHIPIIALTANALKGDREKFIAEGLDEYIPKPIETNELLFILRKFLKAKPMEEEPIAHPTANVGQRISPQDKTTIEPLDILASTGEIDTSKAIKPLSIDKILAMNEPIESMQKEKIILIAKKNPLEAQILSKVITNIDYKIKIVNQIIELDQLISDDKYDLLFIDKELEEFNQAILKKQHKDMSVILLSLNQLTNAHYNTQLIKDVLIGTINGEKIKEVIKKYRGVHA